MQGTLNLESGGEVARNLEHFYNLLRNNLLRSVLEGSTELLEKQSQHILGLREAWLEVRRQHPLPDPRPGSPSTAPPPDGDPDNGQPQRSSKWKA